MKHIKTVSTQFPAVAGPKGDAKSCGPLKDALGACTDSESK